MKQETDPSLVYFRFCSTCGAVMEAPKRLDLRNTGKLMSGVSIKEAIKSLDSRATAAWLPMTAPVLTPAKKQTAAVQTQTVGLFYPSTKTLEKYLAEDETRRVFKAGIGKNSEQFFERVQLP